MAALSRLAVFIALLCVVGIAAAQDDADLVAEPAARDWAEVDDDGAVVEEDDDDASGMTRKLDERFQATEPEDEEVEDIRPASKPAPKPKPSKPSKPSTKPAGRKEEYARKQEAYRQEKADADMRAAGARSSKLQRERDEKLRREQQDFRKGNGLARAHGLLATAKALLAEFPQAEADHRARAESHMARAALPDDDPAAAITALRAVAAAQGPAVLSSDVMLRMRRDVVKAKNAAPTIAAHIAAGEKASAAADTKLLPAQAASARAVLEDAKAALQRAADLHNHHKRLHRSLVTAALASAPAAVAASKGHVDYVETRLTKARAQDDSGVGDASGRAARVALKKTQKDAKARHHSFSSLYREIFDAHQAKKQQSSSVADVLWFAAMGRRPPAALRDATGAEGSAPVYTQLTGLTLQELIFLVLYATVPYHLYRLALWLWGGAFKVMRRKSRKPRQEAGSGRKLGSVEEDKSTFVWRMVAAVRDFVVAWGLLVAVVVAAPTFAVAAFPHVTPGSVFVAWSHLIDPAQQAATLALVAAVNIFQVAVTV